MNLGKLLTLWIGHLLIISVRTQKSPCPDILQYSFEQNRWTGIIRLSEVELNRNIQLQVEYLYRGKMQNVIFTLTKSLRESKLKSGKNLLFQAFLGTLELMRLNEETIHNINNHRPIFYRIIFPAQNAFPVVKKIFRNGQLICRNLIKETGKSILLEHRLKIEKYRNEYERKPKYECGRPQAGEVISLIINGSKTSRGQYPWYFFIFIIATLNVQIFNLQFIF